MTSPARDKLNELYAYWAEHYADWGHEVNAEPMKRLFAEMLDELEAIDLEWLAAGEHDE